MEPIFPSRNDVDVIVIGAGAAGLVAARALAAASARVTLLEARERVGGRVFPRHCGSSAMPADLGAEFIHGEAELTRLLLRECGGFAIATGGDTWMRSGGKLERDSDDIFESARIFERAGEAVADESVEQFLQRFEGDPAIQRLARGARTFVEGFEAADPAVASVRAIAAELSSGVDSTSARPLLGYAALFDFLARECSAAGVRLRLSAAVRRIAWRRGAVDVELADEDGRSETLAARAAIVTLPVAVLRHRGDGEIAFEPELPARHRRALACIETGHVVKVVMSFRTPFWESLADGRYRDAGFFRSQGGPFVTYWTLYPVHAELVVAWAGGPKAVALAGMSAAQLVEAALDGFGATLDARALARAEFESGCIHDWSGDPYARGAYSYLAVGAGDARSAFGEPVDDTLFFAGEATSSDGQGGTVNGAFETGRRAAHQAAAALGIG